MQLFTVNITANEANDMMTQEQAEAMLRNEDLFDVGTNFRCEVVAGEFVNVGCMVALKSAPNGQCPLKFKIVVGSFSVFPSANLINFDGLPLHVAGALDLSDMENLTSFTQLPVEHVGRSIYVRSSRLTNFKGLPKTVPGVENKLIAVDNPITSLEGLETFKGGFVSFDYTESLPCLRLLELFSNNPTVKVELSTEHPGWGSATHPKSNELITIIKNHVPTFATARTKTTMACQRALMTAGFGGNARW